MTPFKRTEVHENPRADLRILETSPDLVQSVDPEELKSRSKVRVRVTCIRGHKSSMPESSIGMTIACAVCGEKSIVCEEVKDRSRVLSNTWKQFGCDDARDRPQGRLIGQMLVMEGLISKLELVDGLCVQNGQRGRLVEILVNLGHLDRSEFENFLAHQPGIPSVNPRRYDIKRQTLKLVPEAFARAHELIPMEQLAPVLTVAMLCPLNLRSIEETRKLTGMEVRPLLCTHDDLGDAFQKFYAELNLDPFDAFGVSDCIELDNDHGAILAYREALG